MTNAKESEIEDLEEIALGKIKIAFNRSIDIESESNVELDILEKRMLTTLFSALLLILTSICMYFIVIMINILILNIIFLLFLIMILVLLIWDYFIGMKRGKILRNLIIDSLILREKARYFLNEKLGKLNKQEYINEIKNLEIADNKIKKEREKIKFNLPKKDIVKINKKIKDLKMFGIKKYNISNMDVENANKRLSKFTALRTCEAWIKFD